MIRQGSRSTVMLAALVAALVLATTLVWATTARSTTISKDRTVKVQVLSTNDFHGRLNPQTVNGAPAGGAA